MKNFFIVTNNEKDRDLEITLAAQRYLEERGRSCTVQSKEQLKKQCTDIRQIPDNVECVIVLGGDGTLIQAARDVVAREIPLIGVNLGTMGYLAEVEVRDLFPALDALMEDRYAIEERMMLTGRLEKGSERHREKSCEDALQQDLALNDIVISRRGSLRIVEYRIFVNGEHLYTYGADGMIIATPTGSTGYSLSAGGPIISPKATMTLITPICPHTLNTRSIIVPPEDEITVEIGPGRKLQSEYSEVSFDGTVSYPASSGDRIVIRCARKKTKFVRINKDSFLENLRKKFSDNQSVED